MHKCQKTQGDRLIEMRTGIGMNRKEFAAYLGIPYRTMQDWELGKRHMPEYVFSLIQYRVFAEYGTSELLRLL